MVTFDDSQNNIKVTIEDETMEVLKESAVEAYPNETGGFLVGNYITSKHAHISCLVQPTEKICQPCSFERSTEGMRKEWDKLFEQGLIYLGEWHTHPNGSCSYSNTDLEAIRSIANNKDVHIIRPLLLIQSVFGNKGQNYHLYHLDNNQLIKFKSK